MEDSITNVFMAPWQVQVVAAAVKLDLFTLLENGERPVGELAEQCGAVPERLILLLEACAAMGLVHRRGDHYANSHFSQVCLNSGADRYFGDMIKHQADTACRWNLLAEVITGTDPIMTEADASSHRNFIRAMNNLGRQGEADALRNNLDLGKPRRMTDIGGGSGLYSLVLCEKFPELESTIMDRKETLDITREFIDGRPEAGRIHLREADYTVDDYGRDNDLVLLSDVLYAEAEAAAMLQKAWDSLRPGGQVVIRGYYVSPAGPAPLFGALFALNDLLFDPANPILNVTSLEAHIKEAGFELIRSTPLTERSTLLIGLKPE